MSGGGTNTDNSPSHANAPAGPTGKGPLAESTTLPIPLPPPKHNWENPLSPNHVEPSFLLTFIRVTITIPILLIWIVIGLYIWVPLLLRRILAYVSAVVSSAITRDTDHVISTGINLEHSVSFFFDGFVLIFHSLGFTGRHLKEQTDKQNLRAKEEFAISTIIWAAFGSIWMLVLIIVSM